MQTKELAALRRTIATLRPGRRRRYAGQLRARIERAAQQAHAAGWSYARVSQLLGVPVKTLAKWRAAARERSASALVPVRVVDDASLETDDERGLRLTSPAGYRVDGLSHADVTAMLRELG